MRSIVLAVVAASLSQGCAYHFGSTDRTRTFTGVGYDSGLAYGTGMQVARSQEVTGQPKAVDMTCAGYLAKPVIAIAGGAALAAASDGKPDKGVAVIAILGAVALLLAPNCVATLYFDAPTEVAPTPPTGSSATASPGDRTLPPAPEPSTPANSVPLPAAGGGDPFK